MHFWAGQPTLTGMQWVIRGVVIYLYLFLMGKLVGQRNIRQLTLFDFIVAITLGTIAGAPLSSSRTGLKGAVLSLTTFAVLDFITAYLSLKYPRFRQVAQNKPLIIVENGHIREDAMRKARYNLDDLLIALRLNNVPNLNDVEFAVLEPNGELSVVPKSQNRPVTPSDLGLTIPYDGLPTVLIQDGVIDDENLKAVDLDRNWLYGELHGYNIDNPSDVFAALLDTKGRLYVSRKG
jgi:uncharacterized membrane protein YcaP (DUF421 family)